MTIMTGQKFCKLSAILLLSLMTPASAAAPAASALKGHDTNAPVDIQAARLEAQDRADRAIFSGNVVIHQGSLTMATERLTVAYTNDKGIDIKRLEATGGISISSPSEKARGDMGIYDLDAKTLTIIGNVTLERGPNHLQGGRLTINLTTGHAVLNGGRAADGSGGRVSGRFTVPQRSGQ